MNKQEALEALLVQLREWEEPTAEVPARTPQWVAAQMRGAVGVVREPANPAALREALVVVGAAALYLLRDEVDVADPRSLADWMVEREPAWPDFTEALTSEEALTPRRAGPADPRPINGVIGRRLPGA